ncbi:MAG TPA: SusC/RagA family TonB-linked outer membrane protein [Chitinophagaceae bacterium]
MRITAILLTIFSLQVSANGSAQSVTLNLKNAPVKRVFKEVSRQTGLSIVYSESMVSKLRPVSINVSNASVQEVMDRCLKDQPFSYQLKGNSIVIRSDGASVNNEDPLPPVTITGTVLDENSRPLELVTVTNLRTKTSVTTDNQGRFTIDAEVNDVLEFSFVGFQKRQMRITADTRSINIQLLLEDRTMNEIIVTGYTAKKASEVTGSVQKIRGDELRQGVTTTNALGMLKGKVAGLYITETGGGSVSNRGQVVMRGQASFADAGNTNFGPLIVVDGVITTAANLQDIVNPNDIADIVILKDAASTAIYGSRAAQGVIVVTTKRGNAGQLRVDLSMKYGQTKDDRLVRFMTTTELANHINKHMESQYNNTASLRALYPTLQDFYNTARPFKESDLSTYTNWDKVLFTDGHQKDINLALTAGSEKSRVYGAINWYREDGTLIDDNLDRKALRLNIDQEIGERFSVSLNTNAIFDKYTASTSENQYYLFQPWVSPYYANGELADSIPNYSFRPTTTPLRQWYDNTMYSHSYNTSIRKIQSLLGSVVLRYKILPWLTAQSTNSVNLISNNFNSYRDPRTFRGRWDGAASNRQFINGSISINETKTEYFLTSNQLQFGKSFGLHNLSALAGQEYGKTHIETFAAEAYNTPYPGERNFSAFNNFGNWINLLTGTSATPLRIAPIDKASFSLFGEVNYNYAQKYFGSASLRRDASTNFGKLNRYGNFYSISGAWLLSRENFMQNIKPVSHLRLRAAYGTSGREAGADFLNFTVYQDNVRYDNNNTFGSTIQRLGNDQITWETTYSTNVGLDIGLWNRIDINVDWYNRRSTDLIQTVQLPSYIGFPQQIRNIAELKNTGVEILISSQNIKSGSFLWDTDFNISFNKNELTKIYNDSLIDPWSGSFYRYVGEDLNVLKAVTYVGVNPANGRPQFERVMPDGKIQIVDSLPLVLADGIRGFKTVGSATPKFFGGLTNTFRYKGFTLSTLFNFVYGNVIMNQSLNNFLSPTGWQGGFNLVNPDESIRFWQGPGDEGARYPNFYDLAWAQRGATNFRSSLIYHDASYIRLRNVRLGYDIPALWAQKARMKNVPVYLSADNIFVIKSDELFASDPEGARIGATSGAFTGTGFASSMPRRYLMGINLSF